MGVLFVWIKRVAVTHIQKNQKGVIVTRMALLKLTDTCHTFHVVVHDPWFWFDLMVKDIFQSTRDNEAFFIYFSSL